MFKRIRLLYVIIPMIFTFLLFVSHLEVSADTLIGKDLYLKKGVSIEINGKNISISNSVLNKSGHLLLPMRDLYEALNAKVQWDQKSQTASALRNGQNVVLTINSTTSKINGKNVTMDVAPFLYKNRTYIPLRFVSENLDGKVNWNQVKQKVEIILNGSTGNNPAEVSYVLYMNNTRVVMDDPVLINQGRTYIPATYFYEHLDNASGTWLSGSDLELQIAGLNFVFSDGKNTVLVNQDPVQIEEKPFIQSGKMYVPVHFIVNALGGNLRNLVDKKELYLYLYQYMFKSEFIEKSYGSTSRPALVPSARLEGNRSILVSDNPETLTPAVIAGRTATLAEQKVQSVSASNEHRVFGWHLNKLGTKAKIGITIQNTSENSTLQIVSSNGYDRSSGNSWINYDIGLPIADAILNRNLNRSLSTGMIIKPGETKIIESYELYANNTIGFIHDLDIQTLNGGESKYTLRTVLAKENEEFTLIHSDPISIDRFAAHPRGAWPNSTILTNLPAYTIDTPEAGYNISNGQTDHLLTVQNSLSNINGAVGNPGHFGMVYKVNIPILNPAGGARTVSLKLAGRGGLYNGAVRINGHVRLIPTLKPGLEYVELQDFSITEQATVISLEIMHAGGGNLPAAIYVETK